MAVHVIPSLFYPGLDTVELALFEVVQTALCVALFVGLGVLVRTRLGGGPSARRLAIVATFVELGNLGLLFAFYLLFYGVLAGVVLGFALAFLLPFLVIYNAFSGKDAADWKIVAYLYLVAYLPAGVASMFLTQGLFELAGVHVWFIFS
ncbi:MAG: hypothetical protein ACTSU5_16685 [Promethearchaeota archaeon]